MPLADLFRHQVAGALPVRDQDLLHALDRLIRLRVRQSSKVARGYWIDKGEAKV